MKRQVVIFEHDFYRFYAAKQVLEGVMRLPIKSIIVEGEKDFERNINELRPGAMVFRPEDSLTELIEDLRSKGITRLNSEVCFVLIHDSVKPYFEPAAERSVKIKKYQKAPQPRAA